jgi:hypothetical protein
MTEISTEVKNPVPAQLPDEPDLWYGRFHIYVLLGSGRNMVKAWKEWEKEEGKDDDSLTISHQRSPKFKTFIEWEDDNAEADEVRRPSGTAYDMAKKWAWKQRARIWDAANRQIMTRERERRAEEARERRLLIVDELIDEVQLRFGHIDWSELTAEGLVLILKRLFEQERLDYREEEGEGGDLLIFAQWIQQRQSRLSSIEHLPEPDEIYGE